MPPSSKRTVASIEASESSRQVKFSKRSEGQRSQTTNVLGTEEDTGDAERSDSADGDELGEENEIVIKVNA